MSLLLGQVAKPFRGILVKLVIYVSQGHWKAKVPNYWKSYCFGYLVPVYTASDEKKTTGHLIAPYTSLLCLIQRIPMSPRDKYFLYHVLKLKITCILHKSFVTGAIKIQFILLDHPKALLPSYNVPGIMSPLKQRCLVLIWLENVNCLLWWTTVTSELSFVILFCQMWWTTWLMT